MTDEQGQDPGGAPKADGGAENGPQAIRIVIELEPKGDLRITGPVGDPVLFLGMLDMARARVIVQMAAGQMRQELLDASAKTKLWTPDGMRRPQ